MGKVIKIINERKEHYQKATVCRKEEKKSEKQIEPDKPERLNLRSEKEENSCHEKVLKRKHGREKDSA